MNRRTAFARIAAFLGGVLASGTLDAQQARNGAVTVNPRALKPAPPGPLPPLPAPGYAPARPMQIVRETYEFAARHPEVLTYIPCYCGCESVGHGGNHDCFVRSRDALGKVTWNDHSWHCTVCIDVARDAMLMHNSGASPTAIRAAIDQKWGTRFPSHTLTPPPPRAPAKPTR